MPSKQQPPPRVRPPRQLSTEEYLTRARPIRSHATMLALFAVVILAGLGVAIAYYRSYGPAAINADVTGYHVTRTAVSVTFTVTRDDRARSMRCVLRARDKRSNTIGSISVSVPPGAKSRTITSSIPVHGTAVVGEVASCTYDSR